VSPSLEWAHLGGGGVPPWKRPPFPMRRRSHRRRRCCHRRMAVASSMSPWNPLLSCRHNCACSVKRPLESPLNGIFLFTSVNIAVYTESLRTLLMRRVPLFSGET
jgi:hypothetical protein